MEIPRVSEMRPPFGNFRPLTEVSEQHPTAIEKRHIVSERRPLLGNSLLSGSPPENKLYISVL
jgi:hypothetical protein